MEVNIALAEHFSTELNNRYWGQETRNGLAYAQDIERRLLAPEQILREMDRSDIEFCILSLTSPEIPSIISPKLTLELARSPSTTSAAS